MFLVAISSFRIGERWSFPRGGFGVLALCALPLMSSCSSTALPEGYCHGELAEERILTLEDDEVSNQLYLDSLEKCAEAGFPDYQWAWGHAILAEVYMVAGQDRFEGKYQEIDGLRWLVRSAERRFVPALEYWSEAFSWGWYGEKDPEAARACLQTEDPQGLDLCLSGIKKLLKQIEERDRESHR